MGFYEYIYQNSQNNYQNKIITRKSNKINLCKLNLENTTKIAINDHL